jgi:hypothetical protein
MPELPSQVPVPNYSSAELTDRRVSNDLQIGPFNFESNPCNCGSTPIFNPQYVSDAISYGVEGQMYENETKSYKFFASHSPFPLPSTPVDNNSNSLSLRKTLPLYHSSTGFSIFSNQTPSKDRSCETLENTLNIPTDTSVVDVLSASSSVIPLLLPTLVHLAPLLTVDVIQYGPLMHMEVIGKEDVNAYRYECVTNFSILFLLNLFTSLLILLKYRNGINNDLDVEYEEVLTRGDAAEQKVFQEQMKLKSKKNNSQLAEEKPEEFNLEKDILKADEVKIGWRNAKETQRKKLLMDLFQNVIRWKIYKNETDDIINDSKDASVKTKLYKMFLIMQGIVSLLRYFYGDLYVGEVLYQLDELGDAAVDWKYKDVKMNMTDLNTLEKNETLLFENDSDLKNNVDAENGERDERFFQDDLEGFSVPDMGLLKDLLEDEKEEDEEYQTYLMKKFEKEGIESRVENTSDKIQPLSREWSEFNISDGSSLNSERVLHDKNKEMIKAELPLGRKESNNELEEVGLLPSSSSDSLKDFNIESGEKEEKEKENQEQEEMLLFVNPSHDEKKEVEVINNDANKIKNSVMQNMVIEIKKGMNNNDDVLNDISSNNISDDEEEMMKNALLWAIK